jgi:hypothetical protein
LTVYAEKEEKLDQAVSFATQRKPVRVLPPDEALIEQM